MHNLNYPTQTIYYIAYNIDSQGNREPKSYGLVNTDQCLTTGLENIETFDSEENFLARAQELNLTIDFQVSPTEEVITSNEGNL